MRQLSKNKYIYIFFLIFLFIYNAAFAKTFKSKGKKTDYNSNSESVKKIKNEPDLLYIFKKAYPDIKFISEYNHELNDWKITLSIPDGDSKKTAVLYWCNGALIPEEELVNKENYWSVLYTYETESPLPRDPSTFTEEEINLMRNFGSTDNRKNGAGAPMFFFDELYNSHSKSEVEAHLIRVSFLDRKITVHERLTNPLKKVEERILELAKTNSEVNSFLTSINRNEAYYWRTIAGTGRKSFHSLGIAIDIMPRKLNGKAVFWGWTKDYRPDDWMLTPLSDRWMPPVEVIKIFENEGFIWGGKWAIWDNMHFEYHPELILYSKLISK